MSDKHIHIHNDLDSAAQKATEEKRFNQLGVSIWLTGLSGSGKTTLARELYRSLTEMGRICKILDGDNIRNGLCKDLKFSESDRKENIRRVAEISKLFNRSAIITICSFISPKTEIRSMAQEIIGSESFIEIHVSTSLEECERRDVNGLYAKARSGEIANFTGIGSPYEKPSNPTFTIDTEGKTVQDCIQEILPTLLKLLSPNE